MNTSERAFPEGFIWGAATSAYQIEGSPLADGAGPSVWHRFAHTPGRTAHGDNGDVACDHYRRFPEDVRLMKDLGLTSYRFSLAWSRVLPEGVGGVNPAGLDFYERLVDALLEADIQPNATLFHWDLPAALDDRGGWLNPDVAGWFADYASIVFERLDDRVTRWATINEPWVVVDGGYRAGVLAPGHVSLFEPPIAAHHLLVAHAEAVRAYRALGRHDIGIVVNLEPKYPASESEADARAVQRAHAYMNRYFLDPIFLGSYPDELPEMFGEAWRRVPDDELEAIREPIDFLGINYYKTSVTADAPDVPIFRTRDVPQPRSVHMNLGWPINPKGLTDALTWVTDRYGRMPLYITENGSTFYDPPSADGILEDPLRLAYLRDHLRAAHEALQRGVDLRGYYAWSLLDNFEWSMGYDMRFGLYHVDFETQRRTPKRSALFYTDVIRSNGAVLFQG